MNDFSPLLAALGQTLREERQRTLRLVGDGDQARHEEQRALVDKLDALELLIADFGKLVKDFSKSTIDAFNSTTASATKNTTDALSLLEDKIDRTCELAESVSEDLDGLQHENEKRTDGLATRIRSESSRITSVLEILNDHVAGWKKHLQIWDKHLETTNNGWRELDLKIGYEIEQLHDHLSGEIKKGDSQQTEFVEEFKKLANLQLDALEEAYQKLRSDVDQGEQNAKTRLEEELKRVQGDLQCEVAQRVTDADDRLTAVDKATQDVLHGAINSIHELESDLKRQDGELLERTEKIEQSIETIRDTYPALDRWLNDGQTRAPGTILSHRGGAWQARVSTQEEPGAGSDWDLLVDGIHAIRQDRIDHGELQFIVEFASGREWTGKLSIPLFNYRGRWKESEDYAFYDVVMDDGNNWAAIKDNPQGKPAKSKDWMLHAMRGARGRKGDRGEPGKDGVDGYVPPIEDVAKQWQRYLEADNAVAMNRFRGSWKYNEHYERGDVISSGGGLYLSTISGESIAPPGPMDEGRFSTLFEPMKISYAKQILGLENKIKELESEIDQLKMKQ